MNVGPWKESWRKAARRLGREARALYLIQRDPRVPWYAKLFAVLVVGYVFSPIDPIPDFIPGIGFLDELVVVPIGVALVMKMVPEEVKDECREKAEQMEGKPVSRRAALVVVAAWLLAVALAVFLATRLLG